MAAHLPSDDPEHELSSGTAPAKRMKNVEPGAGPAASPGNPVASAAGDEDQARNFFLLAAYHMLLRIGWIFKTESIIMPAVLDSIGGGGWLRGCLPMLNRFGQSIPPLLASDWLRNKRQKRNGLALTTVMMGACFLSLSLIWVVSGGRANGWLPIVFLFFYALFFICTGINQLIFSTLIGKLIETTARGRLMLISTTLGAIVAITFAWFLLRRWLGAEQVNFAAVFAFTGILFVLAGLLATQFRERDDVPSGKRRSGVALFKMSWATLVVDRNFRLLAVVAALFGMSVTLFPHYQALGRDRMEVSMVALVPWVIAQNVGAALFSIPTGWIGDRYGYRIVLRWLMFLLCVAPILALLLSHLGAIGDSLFFLVFVLIGLTPVTMRAFNNYTLEITRRKYHPRYLSTLSLCMAAPAIVTSTLVGAAVDWLSYEVVFGLVVLLVFAGWLLTRQLREPRSENAAGAIGND